MFPKGFAFCLFTDYDCVHMHKNMTKKQLSGVTSHDLHWKNKLYIQAKEVYLSMSPMHFSTSFICKKFGEIGCSEEMELATSHSHQSVLLNK